MKKIILLLLLLIGLGVKAQITIPGDSLVYGPMFSPVYENKVRVWMLTKDNTQSNDVLALSMTASDNPETQLKGALFDLDDRHLEYNGFETGDLNSEEITRVEDYNLRSYEFQLESGKTYVAKLLKNGESSGREATIKSEQEIIDDFTFLAGGCGRIFDLSRCIDQWEAERIVNGDPKMYNDLMAKQDSDLMIWLGDAVYLLGEEHAHGGCPDSFLSDWDNEEQAFKRYMWYRKYYDELLQSMPQLAITDNHDTGSNEFDKTLPGLPATKKIFKSWWPNPEYLGTEENDGLFSSYKYKDVEFFLTDNRSFRNNTQDQLGDEQLKWLQNALLKSNATFKIIISGTPTFRELGGRNLSSSKRGPHLRKFIEENNIDGVLAYSADLHQQRFMLREQGSNYPFVDVVSGNLNSDAAETDDRYANYKVALDSKHDLLNGSLHAFVRSSVYGAEGDRRLKIEFVNGRNEVFFSQIINQDNLNSKQENSLALELKNVDLTKQTKLESNPIYQFNDKSFTLKMNLELNKVDHKKIIISNLQNDEGIAYGINKDARLFCQIGGEEIVYLSNATLEKSTTTDIEWKYNNLRQQLDLVINGVVDSSWNNVRSPKKSSTQMILGEKNGSRPVDAKISELQLFNKYL